jgi:hypothetical protein
LPRASGGGIPLGAVSGCLARRWRSGRRAWEEITPATRNASSTWRAPCGSKAGSEAPKAREARDNLSRLAALYEAWGRPERAAAYLSPRR